MRQPWEQAPEAWKHTPHDEWCHCVQVQLRIVAISCEELVAKLEAARESIQAFTDAMVIEQLTRATPGEEG